MTNNTHKDLATLIEEHKLIKEALAQNIKLMQEEQARMASLQVEALQLLSLITGGDTEEVHEEPAPAPAPVEIIPEPVPEVPRQVPAEIPQVEELKAPLKAGDVLGKASQTVDLTEDPEDTPPKLLRGTPGRTPLNDMITKAREEQVKVDPDLKPKDPEEVVPNRLPTEFIPVEEQLHKGDMLGLGKAYAQYTPAEYQHTLKLKEAQREAIGDLTEDDYNGESIL